MIGENHEWLIEEGITSGVEWVWWMGGEHEWTNAW
jgi:hypothetical protein